MVGKVIGAGSFGVVREAVQRGTGIRYAVKSVPKMPKRGVPTPRYLLKLRQEVDAMQQLGASLDAVYLAVRSIHTPHTLPSTVIVPVASVCGAAVCMCSCTSPFLLNSVSAQQHPALRIPKNRRIRIA